MSTFSEWLSAQLADLDKSQTDLWKSVGVTSAAVSRWINGEDIPGTKNCIKIATTLSRWGAPVTVDDVLRAAGHMPGVPAPVRPRSFEQRLSNVITEMRLLLDQWESRKKVLADSYLLPTDGGPLLLDIMGGQQTQRLVSVFSSRSPADVVATLTVSSDSEERRLGMMRVDVPWVRSEQAPLVLFAVEGWEFAGFGEHDLLWVHPTRQIAERGVDWSVGDHVICRIGDRSVSGWVRRSSEQPVLIEDGTNHVHPITTVLIVGVIIARTTPERDRG